MHGDLALALAKRVAEQCARDDVAGVVVTHGTDTMEESVYTVDRVHDSEKPVVFTGAQRGGRARYGRAAQPPYRDPGRACRRVRAAAGRWSSPGHGAREVRKVHTSALEAFGSPGKGRSATSTGSMWPTGGGPTARHRSRSRTARFLRST